MKACVAMIVSWIVVVLYGIAWLLYLRDFYQKRTPASVQSQSAFSVALFAHIALLAWQTWDMGRIPFATVSETLTTFVAITAALYWVQERRLRNYSMSTFILPVLLLMLVVSVVTARPVGSIPDILRDVKFEIHVFTLLVSYGAFTVSFIASLLFLFLSREIKKRRLGLFYSRLPSLPFFEQISNTSVNTGLVFGAIGLAMGTYFALQVWSNFLFSDPKFAIAFGNYIVYLLHFLGRKYGGWQGRRAAIISLVGFAFLLFSFLITSLLLTSVHKFS